MEEARAMAKQIADNNPKTLAAIKDCLHYSATATLEQAMKYEQETAAKLRK
jgi:enoyl-CoA hydratase/carnithine racemase